MWAWLLMPPVILQETPPSEVPNSDMSPQDRFALRLQQVSLTPQSCDGLPFCAK